MSPPAPDHVPDDDAESVRAQHQKGRLTARERIALLCDENSFEENVPAADSAGTSVITGSGTIHGRRVFVFAKNHCVFDGVLSTADAARIVHLQDSALAAHAPLIGLYDSDGLRLEDGFAALAGCGEIVQGLVRAAGGIPRLSLIMGPCTGADAFLASLSDFIFMAGETSTLFVTGPGITNSLTGEDLTAEALGGASLHMKYGFADAAFSDDIEALAQLRRFIDFLPASKYDRNLNRPCFDTRDRGEPSLDMLVPDDLSTPYDVREIILKIVDEGDVFTLQDSYAENIITGFARMQGRTVGVIASQPLNLGGVLDVSAVRKAERLIGFCACFNIPIVTLADVPGCLPGQDQEQQGLARHGAALLSAYATAAVPKISVILGQAFGPAALMMGAKALGADRVFAWPSATIGLMKAKGAMLSASEAQAQGFVDAVITPRRTRQHIIEALTTLHDKRLP